MPRKPSPAAPDDALRALLTRLNLTAVEQQLDGLLRRAETGRPAYSDFLQHILEAEDSARWERKLERRRRRSRLGAPATLDGFNWAARPDLAPQVVKELMTCRFVEERRNVILVGRPSTGKTTVARALGHAACGLGKSVYYGTMAETLEAVHAACLDGTFQRAFRRVSQPDLLILDDAGFARLGAETAHELFRLVCARHRQRSTILVSNLPFRKWGEFLPSPAQAVAIADRLIDDATILRFTGEPYRKPRDVYGAPLDGE